MSNDGTNYNLSSLQQYRCTSKVRGREGKCSGLSRLPSCEGVFDGWYGESGMFSVWSSSWLLEQACWNCSFSIGVIVDVFAFRHWSAGIGRGRLQESKNNPSETLSCTMDLFSPCVILNETRKHIIVVVFSVCVFA